MLRKTPIVYLLLIGIPALLLTCAAGWLLMGVRAQVAALEQERYRTVAQSVGGEVAAWIASVQRDLLQQVESAVQDALSQQGSQGVAQQQQAAISYRPDDHAAQNLRQLQSDNPFVRNTFLWEKGRGVFFPVASRTDTEEQRFLVRFAPLFRGDYAWQENRADQEPAYGVPAKQMVQQSLQIFSRRARAPQQEQQRDDSRLYLGWIPWFEGNQLHLLGWVEVEPGWIAGVELEMSAVLSRLHPMMEPWTQGRSGGLGLELTDGHTALCSAGVVASEGAKRDFQKKTPACEWPVGALLPHWVVKIYPLNGVGRRAERTILLVGGVVLLLLVVSLVAGGVLLVREVARQRLDALQKTNFVSNVSHELKTPLTSIRMYAELLADGKAATQEVVRQYLGVIVTESERLTRLVNNVLDFGRLEQKRRTYHCQPLNLADVVDAVIEPMRGILAGAEMSLAVKKEEDVVVKADRDALSQVIVNLVDNACKYASDGKTIDVMIGLRDSQGVLEVADRGPGIPKAHAHRIFERFFRVDDSLTATVGGSGLGLSIAKQLMHGMGGEILWRPREGGGSVFTVLLQVEDKQ